MALPRAGGGGKEERGRALIVAGSLEVPGAALLAGEAAYRAGAGKVQLAVCASLARGIGLALPECRVFGLVETDEGQVGASNAELLSVRMAEADATLVGPGMLASGELTPLVERLVGAEGRGPLVVDADCIPCLGEIARRVQDDTGPLVITPNASEMAALLGCSTQDVEADQLSAGRDAARRLRAVVAMKGQRTFLICEDGEAWEYAGGGPGLGTSGSGDVLAGLIVGLLARGAEPRTAAAWAVYAHGGAGTRLARKIGALGFLAREIGVEAAGVLGRGVNATGLALTFGR